MAADRAINMALRVLGIGEVERDFKRVGDAGNKSFSEVKKAANGAALEVSDYTARLKRAADLAKQMAANTPALNKGSAAQIRTNRRDFVLGAVQGEQERILKGLPDATNLLDGGAAAAGRFGMSLGSMTALGTAAGSVLAGLGLAAKASLEAFVEHEKALSAFNATLALSGNRSTATGAQIRAMANDIIASTGQTEASVLQAANALAKIPGLSREGLKAALDAAAMLADSLGTDVASVVNDTVVPAFQALATRDMKALFDATKDLNPQLRELVLTLGDAGKTAEAQQALVNGLAEAAGDGPGGLTSAGNAAANSWRNLKLELGADLSQDAQGSIHAVADLLDWLREKIHSVGSAYTNMLNSRLAQGMQQSLVNMGFKPQGGVQAAAANSDPDPYGTGALMNAAAMAAADARVQARWGPREKPARGRSGGRKGGGAGASEKDNLQREADRARAAADRIAEANADVVKSWEQRAGDVEAMVGLEGEALKAVERQQEVEAAVRRINTDAIEKEVEARRKAAAAAHQQFDEAAATTASTAAVQAQQSAVRDLAERYVTATEAQAEFTRRQQEAKSVLEGLKTPIEKLNDEIERSIDLLKNGSLSVGDFDKRMDQISHSMARASLEADKGKQIWVGFGEDVSRTLSDVIMHGGDAREVLQQLIQLPLERLMYKNFEQPMTKAIDKLFGVDEETNAAGIKGGMVTGAQVLGARAITGDDTGVSMTGLTTATQGATTALDLFAAKLGATGPSLSPAGSPVNLLGGSSFANDNGVTAEVAQPLQDVGQSAKAAGAAMQQLVPLTGQFGGALEQALTMLSSASGGGGSSGLLSTVFSIAGTALGGISAGTVARLAPDVASTIAANPALFASGTDDAPIGRPFWVGENGREKMEMTAAGKLRVLSNQQSHRMVEPGGGGSFIQNFTIPERADPRRTASGIARATQGGIARASRKGLAMPGRFS